MKKIVYPGSFDPITNGHLDLIERASKMCDELVVAVLRNQNKKGFFTMDERMELLARATAHLKNVRLDCFEGLLLDYMHQSGSNVILRGLRAVSDFEYELQWAMLHQTMDRSIEAVYLMTDAKYSFLSSGMVREIGSFGGDISSMVPACIMEEVSKKLNQTNKKQ